MKGRLWMHVRELPSGRAIVSPVPFTDLDADAPTVEAAFKQALSDVEERVEDLGAVARAAMTLEPTATLDEVIVEVPARPQLPGGLTMTLSLVVVEYPGADGAHYGVYAPGVPRWSAVARTREEAVSAAAPSLQEHLAEWHPIATALADLGGQVRLEQVEIALEDEPPPKRSAPADTGPRDRAQSGIAQNGDDLTFLAQAGKLGRLDRRDPLVERVLAILAGESRSSVLLVGEADVGKTALVHELAFRLSAGEVPPALRDRWMLRISANDLIAGAQYTGMWQGRARQLIDVGRKGAIIVMEDPRGIVDAGRWSQSDNNLSRVLLPYIQRGELKVICEGTTEAIAAAREKEASFIEAFQRVEVPEPDADAVAEILTAARQRIEANHGVSFGADAVPAALELTRRFEPYRALPGKAVRLLEETAQHAAGAQTGHAGVTAGTAAGAELGRDAITTSFATRTGLPVAVLSDEVTVSLSDVHGFFDQRVLGQAEAVGEMVDLIAVIKAALNDPTKPLASLFFVGPTGVGKTELCKALAEYLFGSRDRVIRFDMGEFASGDAAARLVGSGWDRDGEGELTRRLREQPFCVLLLDEIEKAHRSVFDVLLSALGEGRVTDAQGRTADLRNAIVIMTSNLGAGRGSTSGLGFGREGEGEEASRRRAHFVSEAEKFFRPEFFNRIDRLIIFEPLARGAILRIARRELGRLLLREGITRRQLLVEIDPAVPDLIAAAGFHPRYGARPLHREIERSVIRPLARVITEQRPSAGDLLRLAPGDGGIEVTVDRVREAPAPVRRARPVREESGQSTLNRAGAEADALLETVRAEIAGGGLGRVQAELTGLLERVNGPGFWDDADAAQRVLARTYQLQRVMDRAQHMLRRAEGLVELATQLRQRRDRARLPDLRAGIGELEEQLLVLRLEAAGAAGGDGTARAELSVTPVGGASAAWADRLVAMYAAWAERGGREVERDGHGRSLIIGAPGVLALLAGEVGLHRHDGAEQLRELARVSVSAIPADGVGDDSHDSGAAEPGIVVRVYSSGPRTGVRDPRTRVSVGNLDAVLLDGRIDEFMLAAAALTARTE